MTLNEFYKSGKPCTECPIMVAGLCQKPKYRGCEGVDPNGDIDKWIEENKDKIHYGIKRNKLKYWELV